MTKSFFLLLLLLAVTTAAVLVKSLSPGQEFRVHLDGTIKEYRRQRISSAVEEVYLLCNPYKEVIYCGKWQETKDGQAKNKPVNTGSHTFIDKNGDLVIKSLRIEDAGKYWSPDEEVNGKTTPVSMIQLQMGGF